MAKTEKFIYDVFISYAGKDRAWIKKNLLSKLKQEGIKYCVDYRDFAVGKSAMTNMSDAVKNSRHTVLVMTPNWVKTEWTFFEALLSRKTDPAGIRQRTIPMLVKKCEVDDILSILTWVDLTERGSKATAWNQLYTALGKRPALKQPRQIRKKKNADWHLAHPYGLSSNFTGRIVERNMLSQWLNEDRQHPLLILRALGGFGKSALSWYWMTHNVDSAKWQKVVFWSFYEGDASFENFLKETLEYLGFANPERINPREQTNILLNLLRNPGVLLIMDGFERALRAYSSMDAAYQADEVQKDKNDRRDTSRDCISLFAEVFLSSLAAYGGLMHSKVLMTTRLTPHALERHGRMLEGCLEKELFAMDKEDAVTFFRYEGIRGTNAEIEEACAHYGFHPLSLRLLAGLIISDLQTPGDIAVAKRLDISNDIVQNKHHVLDQAYKTMPKERRKLLSQIACFRSPVTYDALKSITTFDIDSDSARKPRSKNSLSERKAPKPKKAVQYPDFDNDLRDLLVRGLLHHDAKTNKYDLHPIVRHYAYNGLTVRERTGSHKILVIYFDAVAKPQKVEKLEDLAPVIELFHHTVRVGKLDDARVLYQDRLEPLYYQFGAYQLIIELMQALFIDSEGKLPRLKKEGDQAWTLNELAMSYSLSGQPRRAVPLFEMHNAIFEKAGDKKNLAIGLGNAAQIQLVIGALSAAERDLRRSIDLCRKIADKYDEGIGYAELGLMLVYAGLFRDAEKEFPKAIKLFEKGNDIQYIGVVWSYLALCSLLMAREEAIFDTLKSNNEYRTSAIECAQRALELADVETKQRYSHPRDYIRAYWLLGAAYRANSDLTKAEENLSKAISMCRQINNVESEANILLDIACLRYDKKNYEEAKSLADEALSITERCGYVLQGADVNLFLAQYALEQEKDKVKAKEYAESALKLAYCDGPPYYYKVAYDEAVAMLERLKV